MKNSIYLLLPFILFSQGEKEWIIRERVPVEMKPKAFYYTIDLYQPIGIALGENRFILDHMLILEIEKAVGKCIFLVDENLLRRPVRLEKFVDLDKDSIPIDVAKFKLPNLESWEIQILDGRGNVFRSIKGKGSLPEKVNWDGKGDDGESVLKVGDIYGFKLSLRFKDGTKETRLGSPIDLNGVSYGNVVAIKQTKLEGLGPIGTGVARDYLQYVINKFREKLCKEMEIVASDIYLAETIKDYLQKRLFLQKHEGRDPIVAVENPGLRRVEFVLK